MLDPQDALEQILRGHGLRTVRSGDWIRTGEGRPELRAWLPVEQAAGSGCSVQLDVNVAAGGGAMIVESVGGAGRSKDEAVRDAVENFSKNSLHVLLAAFWDECPCEDQVEAEEWDLGGERWRVVIGPYGVRTFGGASPAIPSELWALIERLARSIDFKRELFWLRTFFCNIDGTDRMSEALLNNEDWPEAREALLALPWPQSAEYYSVRHFMILRRLPK